MPASSMPQEITTWYLLPAIRKELAKSMMKNGMTQREAAKKLGVTDAAISQYISGKRACDVKLGIGVSSMVKSSAKKISEGSDAMGEINRICEYCMDKLVICRLHKAHGAPRKCDICFRRRGS